MDKYLHEQKGGALSESEKIECYQSMYYLGKAIYRYRLNKQKKV